MRKFILATITKPITLGAIVIALFAALSYSYYSGKEQRADHLLVKTFDSIGFQIHNLRLKFRGPQTPEAPVAILAVDEESLEKLGHWPWPRSVFAEVLQALGAYGAKNLAFDVIFSEEDQKSAISSLQRVRHLGRIDATTHPELDQICRQRYRLFLCVRRPHPGCDLLDGHECPGCPDCTGQATLCRGTPAAAGA